MKNDIERMSAITFSSGSHPIVDINDNSLADVPVDVPDYPLNFCLDDLLVSALVSAGGVHFKNFFSVFAAQKMLTYPAVVSDGEATSRGSLHNMLHYCNVLLHSSIAALTGDFLAAAEFPTSLKTVVLTEAYSHPKISVNNLSSKIKKKKIPRK